MIKLDISHLSWQLNKSFNISRGSKNTAETIEVKLTENKFTGIGECVPYGRYNETLESVQKEILELKDGILASLRMNISPIFCFTNSPTLSCL